MGQANNENECPKQDIKRKILKMIMVTVQIGGIFLDLQRKKSTQILLKHPFVTISTYFLQKSRNLSFLVKSLPLYILVQGFVKTVS